MTADSRSIDATTAQALQKPVLPLMFFAEMEFGTGTVRVHFGPRGQSIHWNGVDWLGIGGLGSITPVVESAEMSSTDIEISLSGIDPDTIAIALSEEYYGRKARLWLAVLDDDHQIHGEPVGPFLYLMDRMSGEIGNTSSIKMTTVSPMAAWETPKVRRYTDADQQEEFPGDLGMQYVTQMAAGKDLVW